MNKRQTRLTKVQKNTNPLRQPEHKPVQQQEQGPVQMVSPQVAYQRAQVRGNGLRPVDLLVLQRTMGNRRVQRMVQKVGSESATSAAQPQRPVISPDIENAMRQDVEQIVALLREQVMDSAEERQALDRVKRWANADTTYREQSRYQGSDYLDRFLFLLKMRTYTRRTARSAWVEQWGNAYDDLWHELEDERLSEFRRLVARSKKQGSAGPQSQRMESAWSYVGKREALGVVGLLKGLGTTLTGTVDVGIWAYWKTSGLPLKTVLEANGIQPLAGITTYVSKSFDETAKILASEMGVDLNEELFAGGPSAYTVGTMGGKVVGALTTAGATAGAGTAGQAFTAVQTVKSVDDLYDSVKKLRKGPPPLSWGEIAKRPDVWAQVVGVVGGAVGVAGGMAKAGSETAKVLGELGVAINLNQAALLVAAYQTVDNDPTIPASEKSECKADLLAQILSTGALTIDARYGQAFKDAWARRAQQGLGGPPAANEPAIELPAVGGPEPEKGKSQQNPATSELLEPVAFGLVHDGATSTAPGERTMSREQWKTQEQARRFRAWAQKNNLPAGTIPARARLGRRDVNPPVYVLKNPDNYYYNPQTHRYYRIGGRQAAETARRRQMRQRIAQEVTQEQKAIGFTGKPIPFGLSKAGRARQGEILKLHKEHPILAGREYEKLIQGEELGLTGLPRAKKIEPLGKGKGGYIAEDIEPSLAKSTIHEITMEGWHGPFGDRKQHQLFLMLKDPNVATLQLTVPKLSPSALAYLMRLQATFPGKLILVAETITE